MWGNQDSPRPCPREGLALTQGDGEPGFPIPPPAGGFGRAQPVRRGRGKPGFPIPPPGGRVWEAQPARRGRGKPGSPMPPFASGGVRRNHSPFLKRQHSLTQVLDKPRPGLLLSEPAHTQPDAQLIQSGGGTGPVKPRQPPGASRRHCRRLEAPARCQFRQKNLEDERHARRSILCIASDCPHRMPMRAFFVPATRRLEQSGEPGVPRAPARGRAWPSRRGMGKPGFPTPSPAGGFGRAAPSREQFIFIPSSGAAPT